MLQLTPIQTKLIEAFLSIAFEESMASVTLQKVAKRAGVPFPTAHYHFGKKQDVLLKLAAQWSREHLARQVSEALEQGEKSQTIKKSSVHIYLAANCGWAIDHPELASFWLFCCHQASARNSPTQELMAEAIESGTKRLENLIYEGIGKKIFRLEGKVEDVAHILYTSLVGAMMILFLKREGRKKNDSVWLKSQLHSLYNLVDKLLR